ncbi:MAG: GatB/YqeY domain-containing protein [Gammaproteobacteria bacterium]|nr:GatB/YqeY domain-containing protein [Gammaproteobacteria bacterium]
MSELKQRINDDVKSAMRSKEKDLLAVLRLITAAVKQIEVDQRIELDDAQMLTVLDKLAKQHRDSIDQYEKAEREDLAAKERYELGVVQSYLPVALSEEELLQLIDAAIAETGAEGMKDMGKVMGILKAKAQGRADMGKLSGQVKAKLA